MAHKLSVVTDETKPAAPKRKRPATIKAAVEMSERDLLVAMRTKVASEIDAGVPAHALAALMRQLHEFDKAVRSLDAREQQEATIGDRSSSDETWQAI